MTALGWTLLAVLYAIGFTHRVVMLRANIIAAHRPFTFSMVNRTKYAWPISMLSEIWNRVRS